MPLEELERRARGCKGEEKHSQETVIRTDLLSLQLNIVKDALPGQPQTHLQDTEQSSVHSLLLSGKLYPEYLLHPQIFTSPNLVRFVL